MIRRYKEGGYMSLSISSDFFNSMLGTSSSSSSTSGLTSLLGDYNAIRNGSYYKLAKHYYETDGAKEATQKKFSSTETSSSLSTQSEDKMTKAAAESAWKDVTALRKEDLYEKNEDGTYDTDAILKGVKAFVSSYNTVLDSAEDSDNTNVLKEATRLVSQTDNYSSSLSKIGITVQSDNSLKLDETAFAAADMEDVKNLFAGDFSFGSNTQSRMLQMVSDASTTVSGLYTSSAAAATSTVGTLYDSLF